MGQIRINALCLYPHGRTLLAAPLEALRYMVASPVYAYSPVFASIGIYE
jgi:hypothetical protein